MTRHKNSISLFDVIYDYFKNLLVSSTIIEWNSLNSNVRNSEHSFQDALNFICNYCSVETTIHSLLHCPNFWNETLFNKLQCTDGNLLSKNNFNIPKVLLFRDQSLSNVKITSVLTASIKYIISKKRFDSYLYQNWELSVCLYAVYF